MIQRPLVLALDRPPPPRDLSWLAAFLEERSGCTSTINKYLGGIVTITTENNSGVSPLTGAWFRMLQGCGHKTYGTMS